MNMVKGFWGFLHAFCGAVEQRVARVSGLELMEFGCSSLKTAYGGSMFMRRCPEKM